MNRLRVLAALALAIALAVLMPGHAIAAESGSLFARGCVAASARPEAVPPADPRGWTCQPTERAAITPYLWVRAAPADLALAGPLHLQGDGMPVEALVTRVVLADGTVRQRTHTAADMARHWTTGSWFSLPLLDDGERAQALMVRIDRPFDRQVATTLRLIDTPTAMHERIDELIMFAGFFGMLLVVSLSALMLFVALRARFALAHAAMMALFAQFTLASSSLIFIVWPGASLWWRTGLSYTGLAWSMAMLTPFMCDFLEPDAVHPRIRRAAWWAAGLLAVTGGLVPVLGPSLPFMMRTIHHLAFVPGMIVMVVMTVTAWRRGSEAIRLMAIAWSLPLAFAAERILRAVGLPLLPAASDYAFFAAMAFQAVVMTFAIAWRIGQVRRERDRAVALEREHAIEAQTDPLTGLPNRRAFDTRHWREGDYLALIDVDRFKAINDQLGHAMGDEVLRAIGRALAADIANGTLVGAWRMGGEEFTALIAAPSIDQAALQVNRLRDRLSANISATVAGLDRRVTVSAGIARIDDAGIAPATAAADRALYHAKASGRDRLSWEADDNTTATTFPPVSEARSAAA